MKGRLNELSAIREYLQEGNSLTPLEALNKFGSFRLAVVICRLRKQGMRIRTEKATDPATGKEFARYSLEKGE